MDSQEIIKAATSKDKTKSRPQTRALSPRSAKFIYACRNQSRSLRLFPIGPQ
jgi:hypothetical protein